MQHPQPTTLLQTALLSSKLQAASLADGPSSDRGGHDSEDELVGVMTRTPSRQGVSRSRQPPINVKTSSDPVRAFPSEIGTFLRVGREASVGRKRRCGNAQLPHPFPPHIADHGSRASLSPGHQGSRSLASSTSRAWHVVSGSLDDGASHRPSITVRPTSPSRL